MPMLGTSIRRRFLVGGAITCLLLGILPGSAVRPQRTIAREARPR